MMIHEPLSTTDAQRVATRRTPAGPYARLLTPRTYARDLPQVKWSRGSLHDMANAVDAHAVEDTRPM